MHRLFKPEMKSGDFKFEGFFFNLLIFVGEDCACVLDFLLIVVPFF